MPWKMDESWANFAQNFNKISRYSTKFFSVLDFHFNRISSHFVLFYDWNLLLRVNSAVTYLKLNRMFKVHLHVRFRSTILFCIFLSYRLTQNRIEIVFFIKSWKTYLMNVETFYNVCFIMFLNVIIFYAKLQTFSLILVRKCTNLGCVQ